MLETKEQKQIFAGSMILIIILIIISAWHRPDLTVQEPPLKSNQDILNSKAYLDYLRAANVDQAASQELFQTILTKDEITQEVKEQLQVNQAITPPAVDEKKIQVSKDTGSKAVTDYLTASVSQVYSFNTNTAFLADSLFGTDPTVADQLKPKINNLIGQLYTLKVPKDAAVMDKALITTLTAYGNLLDSAKTFNPEDYTKNDAVWPQVYNNYVVANDSGKLYADELNKLAAKYKISYIPVNYYAEQAEPKKLGNMFVPEAQAFVGISDTSFNFTLGDIPRIIMDGAQESLRSAFLQFMGTMLNKLITKIEQNYVISNFLYYSDALVNGQYVDDYLNKYVSDPLDRSMVKNFIPQFNCGNNPNLKNVFQAQANQYLGFDPATISPSDPQFYTKMARMGDFLSSPQGWEAYYEGLAQNAESAAQHAVDLELTSSGLKTPRDTIQSSISSSISNIVSAQRASFGALLQLGINNADSIVSGVVGQLTQTLVNQFVFQGVTGSGGNIAVFKEQKTCVSTAMLSPVLPLPMTQVQTPAPPPTQQAAMAQACSGLSSLGSDCTSSIMGELNICANNPSGHTGYQTCSDLSKSSYVKILLAQCSLQIRPTSDCVNLQSYISKIH